MGDEYISLLRGLQMEHQLNPLIEDNPADTLYNARSILAALQECYCAKDAHEREPEAIVYTGLFWILKCVDGALAFEGNRVTSKT